MMLALQALKGTLNSLACFLGMYCAFIITYAQVRLEQVRYC